MALRSQIVAMTGLLALLGAPVLAEAPFCWWDSETRSFGPGGDLSTLTFRTYPNSFVASLSTLFSDHDASVYSSEVWGVLHHCESDNHMSFRVDSEKGGDAIVQHFFDRLDAPEKITMPELADELREQGADVWQGKGGIGNCDCLYADMIKTSE